MMLVMIIMVLMRRQKNLIMKRIVFQRQQSYGMPEVDQLQSVREGHGEPCRMEGADVCQVGGCQGIESGRAEWNGWCRQGHAH